MDPERILLVGDVHGDTEFVAGAARRARALGLRTIVQLGDLGALWPGSTGWLAQLDRVLSRHGVEQLVFIDGNHEGWTSDVAFAGAPRGGGLVRARRAAPRTAEGFALLSERVAWADRATRWTWCGRRFGALGGAFSIDWRGRSPGRSWWPDLEEPSETDVDRLVAGGALDVLLTHDAPIGTGLRSSAVLHTADEERAGDVRRLVHCAVNETRPRLVVHGHWHHRYCEDLAWMDQRAGADGEPAWASVRVEGLGANISPFADAVAVLDLTGDAPTVAAATPGAASPMPPP